VGRRDEEQECAGAGRRGVPRFSRFGREFSGIQSPGERFCAAAAAILSLSLSLSLSGFGEEGRDGKEEAVLYRSIHLPFPLPLFAEGAGREVASASCTIKTGAPC
jgi:hypothetical protein